MGQRSQIYIRWQDREGNYVLIARYFQWNFAERMISRTRALIEALQDRLQYEFSFTDKSFKTKIERLCDVNFDFRDIVQSIDIIDEYKEYGKDDTFKDYVFLGQDNNDGKLFIDVDVKNKAIKYCLTDYDMNLLDCRKYMDWDYEMWEHDLSSYHYSYTIENLEQIEKNATLMTEKELKNFINAEYIA